ncbi:hypothetical protein BGZ70_008013 [Mortierella alpina]|uniref:Uncharacterized protein n=1 Tax=Mortierella alpina TaxID=64518 RepID=A0A9P6M2B6_MORAP|nr:hypothetical protein BGZ70_008013 [Mortierella alpina]
MDGKHLRCGWLDGDNANGSSVYGMFIDTDVFGSGYGNNASDNGPGAIELCDSPTSWGRSMLSLQEGIFCDMATKTKVPICKTVRPQADDNNRYGKRSLSSVRGTATAVNVSQEALAQTSYSLECFVVSDINDTIFDDGSAFGKS